MQTKILALASAALICGALLAASAPGFAQPATSADTSPANEMVTVYAPFVVRHKPVKPMMSRTASTGLELVSVSRSVSFHDLDLSKPIDAATLENRVHRAAADACSELDKRFPRSIYLPVPEKQDCIGNAVSEAMVSVKQLIASANAS